MVAFLASACRQGLSNKGLRNRDKRRVLWGLEMNWQPHKGLATPRVGLNVQAI